MSLLAEGSTREKWRVKDPPTQDIYTEMSGVYFTNTLHIKYTHA